jgi:hypothetical protein
MGGRGQCSAQQGRYNLHSGAEDRRGEPPSQATIESSIYIVHCSGLVLLLGGELNEYLQALDPFLVDVPSGVREVLQCSIQDQIRFQTATTQCRKGVDKRLNGKEAAHPIQMIERELWQ